MPLVRTNLIGVQSGASGNWGTTDYVTPSFTPPDSSLVVVAGGLIENNGSTTDPTSVFSVSGGTLTWTSRLAVVVSPTSFPSLIKFWTAPVTTGAAMTLTLTTGGRSIITYDAEIVAYTGYNVASPVGATGSSSQNGGFGAAPNPISYTLSGAPATTSEIFSAVMCNRSSGGVTEGVGWTKLYDLENTSGGGEALEVITGTTSTTVSWADLRPGAGAALFNYVAGALEIKAAAASDVTIIDLAGSVRAAAPAETTTVGVTIADALGAGRVAGPAEVVDTGPVFERAGAGRATGPTEIVTASTGAVEDVLVAPTLRQVLACLTAELAKVPSPPAHYRVVPNTEVYPALGVDGQSGATVLDECCEGIAWVRLAYGPYPTASFPEEEPWYPDFPTSLGIVVEVGVLRCGGGPGIELAPTDAVWGADAQAVEDDKAAIRRAFCCLQALIQTGPTLMQDVVYGPGRWEPAQGEGNCMGGSLQIAIQLPYCCS